MSIFKYKQAGRIGLFDKEETSNKPSKLGNPLEKLHKIIYFEMLRMELDFRRARGIIGLINLVYNMCHYEQIVRLNLLSVKC